MINFHYFRGPLQTECSELSANNYHLALSFLQNHFLFFYMIITGYYIPCSKWDEFFKYIYVHVHKTLFHN